MTTDNNDNDNARNYVINHARPFVPVIKGHTDVTTDNAEYLTNVAKRAAFELMGFSPLMHDSDTPERVFVNVVNLSHAPENRKAYTVAFEDGKAISCTCNADTYFDTCKHRVRTEHRLGADVEAFLADVEDVDDSDDSDDVEAIVLNRYEGTDRTTGSIADGLANLRAIKEA